METKLLPATTTAINEAAALLKKGELVAIPTETVYGLAANAFHSEAIAKVFLAKERPSFDPLIVHIPQSWLNRNPTSSIEALDSKDIIDSRELNPIQTDVYQKLISTFWPGPLTLILPKHPKISDLVSSGLPTVGVRMPAHPAAQQLLEACQLPLAAPSANRFGRISPTQAAHVKTELEGRIPLILDGGACEVGVESTVLKVESNGDLLILRPGAVSIDKLKNIFPKQTVSAQTSSSAPASTHTEAPLISPGTTESHYAPQTRIVALAELQKVLTLNPSISKVGVIVFFEKDTVQEPKAKTVALIPHDTTPDSASLVAAQKLFSTLRSLDESGLDLLAIETVSNQLLSMGALWPAISDRITRAIATKKT